MGIILKLVVLVALCLPGFAQKSPVTTPINTDRAGQVTLVGGFGVQALVGKYTSPPIVICSDTTSVATVKCSATTTAITMIGTGTDVINYILIGPKLTKQQAVYLTPGGSMFSFVSSTGKATVPACRRLLHPP